MPHRCAAAELHVFPRGARAPSAAVPTGNNADAFKGGFRMWEGTLSGRVDRIVIMHPDSMAVVPEIPQSLSTVHSFEQRQVPTRHEAPHLYGGQGVEGVGTVHSLDPAFGFASEIGILCPSSHSFEVSEN
jgi:hypothetical protein